MKNDNKGRDIFYGVVAIATLIVAIVGATLAYFSVTASSNEGAVNATAAIVSIEYNDGQQVTAQANELIPATLEVVQEVYESKIKGLTASDDYADYGNVCTDSNKRQVCSAYRFTVRSDLDRTINAVLNNEHNGFTYLSYAVYDVTNNKWLPLSDDGNTYDLPLKTCDNEDENPDNHCRNEETKIYGTNSVNSIFGYTLENSIKEKKSIVVSNTTQEYEIVLFIKENKDNQNIDQGKNYKGTIVVEVMDGGINGSGNITGCVGDNCK